MPGHRKGRSRPWCRCRLLSTSLVITRSRWARFRQWGTNAASLLVLPFRYPFQHAQCDLFDTAR